MHGFLMTKSTYLSTGSFSVTPFPVVYVTVIGKVVSISPAKSRLSPVSGPNYPPFSSAFRLLSMIGRLALNSILLVQKSGDTVKGGTKLNIAAPSPM